MYIYTKINVMALVVPPGNAHIFLYQTDVMILVIKQPL